MTSTPLPVLAWLAIAVLAAVGVVLLATRRDPQYRPPHWPGPQCTCGHTYSFHEHLRRQTDCSLCNCWGFVEGDVHHARTGELPFNVTEYVVEETSLDAEYEQLCKRGAA